MNYPKIFGNLKPNDVDELESALQSLFNNFSSIDSFNKFLSLTGIDPDLVARLSRQGNTNHFITNLLHEFIYYEIKFELSENYHPLVDLSKSLEKRQQKYNLSDREIDIFIFFQTRIEVYFSSSSYRRDKSISNLLKKERKENNNLSNTVSVSNNGRIDKSIIINHNLEDLEYTLKRTLGFRGLFAFNVSGNATILKEYVIQRILREYKKKKPNQPHFHTKLIKIRLYKHSICTQLNTIEQELKRCNFCDKLVDLIKTKEKSDIVLIIWNYDLKREQIKKIVSDFLTSIKIECSDLLKDNNQCLLIILANVCCQVNINGFISLKTPKKFILEGDNGILEWFNYELSQLTDLQSDDIEQYLERIKHHNGHLIGTYQEIQDIIDELNERYD